MDPAVGSTRRSTERPRVVFPQPDSPTKPSVSPAWTEKLTPSTAFTTWRGLPHRAEGKDSAVLGARTCNSAFTPPPPRPGPGCGRRPTALPAFLPTPDPLERRRQGRDRIGRENDSPMEGFEARE